MDNLKLYKVYLVYGKRVMLHMCWARDKKHVYELMNWKKEDKPKPVIRKLRKKEGCFLCHHVTDTNLYKGKV